jgi:raffinose/stachyose/melibiose transport system permease protein
MKNGIKPHKLLKTGVVSIVVLAVLALQVYPILWVFSSSFKSQIEFKESSPFALPERFTLENYLNSFERVNIGSYFTNSLIITVAAVTMIALLSAMVSFALLKMRFRISGFLKVFFIAGIMIPIQVTLIPMFIIYQKLGMLNTHWALILPQVGFGLPMSVYMFTAFYKYIPGSILESGVIDGCSVYRLFRSIVIPMSKNTLITVVTMNAIFIWNEFVLANTFISKTPMKTVPLAIYEFRGDYGLTDWGGTFSVIALTILPILILYFALNKSIISGMAAGAVKG